MDLRLRSGVFSELMPSIVGRMMTGNGRKGCSERHRGAAGIPILSVQRLTVVWIIIGLSVLAVAILGIVGRRRPGSPSDLGWVTEQWLAEHRADQSASSR
ncbi:MAG TPA: hypothetical protein VHJ58_14785 [Vicinamibacterales bacterium]|nr:hypothetical protein [Vicinamibacterales bacterium]